jgi:hypothetical protein
MVGSRHAAVVATLVCFGLWTVSERAHACSPPANMTLEVGDGDTGEAPSGIGDPSATVKRGQGPTGGCAQQSSSCDDMGSFRVHFTAATDVDSSPKSVGYRVEVIAGMAPRYSLDEYLDGVLVPQFDADDGDAATLYFHWPDGDSDDQESIDFTITLTPVRRER